jgi:Periplasmic binding protein
MLVPPAGSNGADGPYEIIAMVPQTGSAALQGRQQSQGLLAVEAFINRTGDIQGRPIKFEIVDTQSSPQITVQLMNDAVAKKVPAVLGPSSAAESPGNQTLERNALDNKHSRPRLRESYLFLVPIDDENHMLFNTQEARVPEHEREAYAAVYAEYIRRRADARPRTEVAADILAGKLRIAEVLDHPNLVTIEDIVAQAGQGRIVDRSEEWLGRSDAGVIFFTQTLDAGDESDGRGPPPHPVGPDEQNASGHAMKRFLMQTRR